jgi:CheY-like chemotaxis protein
MYARAYEERILALKMEAERKRYENEIEQRANERIEQEVRRRMREIYRGLHIDVSKRSRLIAAEAHMESDARKAVLAEEQRATQEMTEAIELAIRARLQELDQRLRSGMEEVSGRITSASNDSLPTTLAEVMQAWRSQVEENLRLRDAAVRESLQAFRETNHQEAERLRTVAEEGIRAQAARESEITRAKIQTAYQSLLGVLQQSGLPGVMQHEIAEAVRGPLEINDRDHAELQRKAEIGSYLIALRDQWRRGGPTPAEEHSLSKLRQLYGITDDEHERLTQEVRSQLGLVEPSVTVVAIDDDQTILSFIGHVLDRSGYTVRGARTIEAVLDLAKKEKPGLIICDLHLGPDQPSGISIFERLRRGEFGERWKNVPFVLMSSLRDDVFVKSAQSIGIQEFVPKPFTKETLTSTVNRAANSGRPK